MVSISRYFFIVTDYYTKIVFCNYGYHEIGKKLKVGGWKLTSPLPHSCEERGKPKILTEKWKSPLSGEI